jgi:phosphocarrier protein HPr
VPLQAKTRVVNSKGLHARPCHALVTKALEFQCEVRMATDECEVNAKSIIELMTLGAACGTELTIQTQGQDAEAALAALVALIASGFGE